MSKNKKEPTWLDHFRGRPQGANIRYRLGFNNDFILKNTTEEELESFRKEVIIERKKARESWEQRHGNMAASRPYYFPDGPVGTMFSDLRKRMRYRNSKSFNTGKLYQARSNVYGDIQRASWGTEGWASIKKHQLLMFVGHTEWGDCLFMKAGGTRNANDYIRISGIQLDRISEVKSE
jgi:hypothetical protein